MTSSSVKFITVVFAVCFMALQFQQFNYLELPHKDNQNIHIEQITLSTNHLPENLYYQKLNLPAATLAQQIGLINKQTQYLNDILQRVVHSFSHFMSESIDALPLLEQHSEFVLFNHLKQLTLGYRLDPVSIHFFLPIKADKTASSLSLS